MVKQGQHQQWDWISFPLGCRAFIVTQFFGIHWTFGRPSFLSFLFLLIRHLTDVFSEVWTRVRQIVFCAFGCFREKAGWKELCVHLFGPEFSQIRPFCVALGPCQSAFICWERIESLIGFGPLPDSVYLLRTCWVSDWLQALVRVLLFVENALSLWLASGPCQTVLIWVPDRWLWTLVRVCFSCWDHFESLFGFRSLYQSMITCICCDRVES